MIGINGNDPLFGFGGIKKTQGNQQQPKVNNDVPVGKPETKELGRDFLDNPYAAMGVNFSKQPAAGSLEDLAAHKNINVSNVGRADKKQAFNAVSDPLTQAYMYGPVNENTMNILAALDGGEFPEFMMDDLLADVVVA